MPFKPDLLAINIPIIVGTILKVEFINPRTRIQIELGCLFKSTNPETARISVTTGQDPQH